VQRLNISGAIPPLPHMHLWVYTETTIPLLNVGAQRLKLMLFIVEVPAYNPGVGDNIMTEDFQGFLQYLYLNAASVTYKRKSENKVPYFIATK
jgi:hypothetical protein